MEAYDIRALERVKQSGDLKSVHPDRIIFDMRVDAAYAGTHCCAKPRVNPAYSTKPDNRDLRAADVLAENSRPPSVPYSDVSRSNSAKPREREAESEFRDRIRVRSLGAHQPNPELSYPFKRKIVDASAVPANRTESDRRVDYSGRNPFHPGYPSDAGRNGFKQFQFGRHSAWSRNDDFVTGLANWIQRRRAADRKRSGRDEDPPAHSLIRALRRGPLPKRKH